MKRIVLAGLLMFLWVATVQAGTQVEMKTSLGTIVLELEDTKAPLTVKNFLKYVDQKYYDQVIFHRVIDKFMIQGGGFDKTLQRKETLPAIKNEAGNGLTNDKGTIAMARTGVVDSATSQFFINLVDNKSLNQRGKTSKTFGYAVFGRVISGLEVVEKIGKVRTIARGAQFRNFPEPQVVIDSIRRLEK